MLSIRVNTNKEDILPFCQQLKMPFTKGHYLYQAVDDDTVLATGLFEISGKQVTFLFYTCVPEETHFLMDGVLRAGYHYASQHGITKGVLPEAVRQEHAHFFKHLNYPNAVEFNIENFFRKYKNCAPGQLL